MSMAEFECFLLSYATGEIEGAIFIFWQENRMDAKHAALKEKLEFHLQQAAAMATEIRLTEFAGRTPHFDEIELPAHQLGQQLSRLMQAQQARAVAAEGLGKAACPECHRPCEVDAKKRTVDSLDGPLELTETVARCSACRRDFFPSAC